MAVGFAAPAVILPEALAEQLDPAALDHVLLHELAHVARYDDWTNLAARFCAAVLQLHPIAAWILGRIAQERESACDDWVVAQTGAARLYAESLARIAEFCIARRHEILATGLAGRSSQLRRRIERLLRQGAAIAPQTSLSRVMVFAAALTMIVAASPRAPRWIAFAQTAPARGVLSNGPASGVADGVSGGINGGVAGLAAPLSVGPANAPVSGAVRPSAPPAAAGPTASDVLQGRDGALPTPQQLDPAVGAELHNYPRVITFHWSQVPGAETYTLEVDCMNCCERGKWCSDVDPTRVATYQNLQTTRYSMDYYGDQPGRWRVSAAAGFLESEKSPWREFSFKTAGPTTAAPRAPVQSVAQPAGDLQARLFWLPVAGAESYSVEIDGLGSCAPDQWCSEVGKSVVVDGIKGTTVSRELPNTKQVRWRVWAVSGQRQTLKSAWQVLGGNAGGSVEPGFATAEPQPGIGVQGPVYKVGSGVTPPVPTYRIEPRYPTKPAWSMSAARCWCE
jgi:hypothetical protein